MVSDASVFGPILFYNEILHINQDLINLEFEITPQIDSFTLCWKILEIENKALVISPIIKFWDFRDFWKFQLRNGETALITSSCVQQMLWLLGASGVLATTKRTWRKKKNSLYWNHIRNTLKTFIGMFELFKKYISSENVSSNNLKMTMLYIYVIMKIRYFYSQNIKKNEFCMNLKISI